MKARIGDYRVKTQRSDWTGKQKFRAQRRRLFFIIPFWSDLTVLASGTREDALGVIEEDRARRWFGNGQGARVIDA